jgi:hypothetical protein
VPGLGTTYGRGGATTAQQDLALADAILIAFSTSTFVQIAMCFKEKILSN